MKTALLFIATACMALGLSACGSERESGSSGPSAEQQRASHERARSKADASVKQNL